MGDERELKQHDIDFLVITIKDLEAEALNQYGFDLDTDKNGRGYWKEKFTNNTMQREITIVHYMIGEQGNVQASAIVSELLLIWKPRCVCVLGIAGGIKKNGVRIGDILIGNQFIYYSLTKEKPDESEIRPETVSPDPLILSQLRLFKNSFVGLVTRSISKLQAQTLGEPTVHIGPIFCGESVLANAEKTNALLKLHPKGIGVEMESYGVYTACLNSSLRPRTFTIRAVSDCADEEKDDNSQPHAAFLAALVFLGFAQQCDLGFTDTIQPVLPLVTKRMIADYYHDSPDVYDVSKDEKVGGFKVSGSTDTFDMISNQLFLYVVEEFELPFPTAIQVGAKIRIEGQLNRTSLIGYAKLSVSYVVLDAYRRPVAETLGFEKILQLLWSPLTFDLKETISHETHRDIKYPLFGLPIQFEAGPYWIGVRVIVDILRGGSVRGSGSEKYLEVEISNIEIAPS